MSRVAVSAAAVAALLCAGLCSAPAGALAAAPRLDLLSPRDHVTKRVEKRTLVVRLRASSAGFSATLDGRDVTGRFSRGRGGVRSARFVRGRDFELGRGSFRAAVGNREQGTRRTVGFYFTAWRVDRRRLRVRRLPPRGVRGVRSLLHLHVRSDARILAHRVWVNGRPVRANAGDIGDHERRFAGGRGFGIMIGATHGLHFGSNRITIHVEHPGNRVQRTNRTVRISRRGPLVGAGRDLRVSPARAASLRGTAKAGRRGARLHYRWRIVSKPRHAKVRLRGRHRRRARLAAKTPGHYRLRFEVAAVRHQRAQRLRKPAFTGAVGSSPFQALTPPQYRTLTKLGRVRSDDVEVTVAPTEDPMGVPIQTITDDSGIQVGSTHYKPLDQWLSILVLKPETLEQVSYTSYSKGRLADAKKLLDGTSRDDIVIMTAAGHSAWDSGFDTFKDIVGEIGGVVTAPETDGFAKAALSLYVNPFSIIGHTGDDAGTAWQNRSPTSEPGVEGFLGADPGRAGSLNGYLQMVDGSAYSYVSPEHLAIDTAAQGSNPYTENVIKVGDQSYPSSTIDNGATGAHLVVLGPDMKLKANATYTIIGGGNTAQVGSKGAPANGDYGTGVGGLAYTMRYFNSPGPQNLIILQTFGQGQWWGNTPNGAPNWVNDNIGVSNPPPRPQYPTYHTFDGWNGQPYVKQDGSSNPNVASYGMWNPTGHNYPTVAGQVGRLTSPAGHDIVAAFGFNQGNNGTPNGGLTVVGSTQPYDGRLNFVKGQTGQVRSDPRLVGTLARTRQGQWTVKGAAASAAFNTSRLWEVAFDESEPWPDSSTKADRAAMRYIAQQLFGAGSGITDVRPQYVLKRSADWSALRIDTQNIDYPGSGDGFSASDFNALKKQLVTEMGYVSSVKNIIDQWKGIFDNAKGDAWVNLQEIARNVLDNALANKHSYEKQQASLNWLEILSESLYVSSDILGFTPAAEVAEPISLFASVFGLASAATPEDGGQPGDTRDDSRMIWDKADQLGEDVYTRYNNMSDTLDHIGDIFLSDWGKLEIAGQSANGAWAFGTKSERALKQSLAISTTREFYKALLPLTYTEWVVNPHTTGATNFVSDPRDTPPDRLALPGRAYVCWNKDDAGWPNPPKTHPFKNSPDGALHYAGIHGWEPPGNHWWPAPQRTQDEKWYTIRVLKSSDDPLELNNHSDRYNPTVWNNGGADPPASLVNPLFEPIDPADTSGFPKTLGMNKTKFFSDFNNGWGLRRMVCG